MLEKRNYLRHVYSVAVKLFFKYPGLALFHAEVTKHRTGVPVVCSLDNRRNIIPEHESHSMKPAKKKSFNPYKVLPPDVMFVGF